MGRDPLDREEIYKYRSDDNGRKWRKFEIPSKHKQAIKFKDIYSLTHSYTAKKHNIPNHITDENVKHNLSLLVDKVLRPVQNKFGQVYIVSGYRGSELNNHVNGVTNSQHTKGQAVDFYIPNYSLYEVAKWIELNLVYDQLIIEEPAVGNQSWIHISYNPDHTKNRNQEMVMSNGKYFYGIDNLYKYAGSLHYHEPYLPDEVDNKTIRAMLYAVSKLESAHGTKPYGVKTWYMGSLDRAVGFYHIMGKNVEEWSLRYLGKKVSINYFINSPEYQHKLMAYKFNQELEREQNKGYSTDEAVKRIFSIHFSGSPNYKSKIVDANGTTVNSYSSIVYKNYKAYLTKNS